MEIDRQWLSKVAREEGFVRNTLEKVYRLREVLLFLNQHPLMKECLALKGGTAINLTVFNLPRLSVDIDLDYSKEIDREGMLEDREEIISDIEKYMTSQGYQLLPKSKSRHSLESMIYGYKNTAGINDNIKLEINFSMRSHIYPLVHRQIQTGSVFEEFEILSVDGIELFGSKIKALLDRAAPRDLYDVDNMVKYGLFSGNEERIQLKKCVLFYMAVGNKEVSQRIDLSVIDDISWYRIKTDLIPVKRKGEKFDLDITKKRIKEFLSKTMQLDESEKIFLEKFQNKEYHPEYLFDDPNVVERIRNHPMAMWKMR
ncbi:MAG: nucleotidyl transferase AbiEii/AbiGii toxin family protein [Eubacteriales bacterium]